MSATVEIWRLILSCNRRKSCKRRKCRLRISLASERCPLLHQIVNRASLIASEIYPSRIREITWGIVASTTAMLILNLLKPARETTSKLKNGRQKHNKSSQNLQNMLVKMTEKSANGLHHHAGKLCSCRPSHESFLQLSSFDFGTDLVGKNKTENTEL